MKKLFDEIPRLQNQRVVLKQITHKDADALREMTQSAAVYRFLPTFLFEKQFDDRAALPGDGDRLITAGLRAGCIKMQGVLRAKCRSSFFCGKCIDIVSEYCYNVNNDTMSESKLAIFIINSRQTRLIVSRDSCLHSA